jgi:hypothetical protein
MTRDDIAAELNGVRGAGFAASADYEAAVDQVAVAHAAGVSGIVEILTLVKLLLPFFQDNLPALIDLLSKLFAPKT